MSFCICVKMQHVECYRTASLHAFPNVSSVTELSSPTHSALCTSRT